MKKLILGSLIALASFETINAQSLDDINKAMLLASVSQKYADVKPLVDKAETNEKVNTKPELYATKANLYANLAKQPGVTPENAIAYRSTALAAWEKYKTMDPSLATLKENVNGPVALYSSYITEAIAKFNAKDWATAYTDFKTSADISDVLIAHKLINMSFDTTANLYAGASAQNLKKEDDAVMMFTKLADKKIAGAENEFLYQFLANYYMDKKDDANFKKYVDLGKSLYPKSKYFAAIEGDYVRNSNDINKIVPYDESKIAENPNDYTLHYDLGGDIYNYLNPKDTSKTPKGDVSAMEGKMIGAFTKASEIKPEAGMPYSILGNFYYNKAATISTVDLKNVKAAMKSANAGIKPDKNGKLPPIPKELITKQDQLYKQYDAYEDSAMAYFEKAAAAFGKAEKVEPFEKQHYKNDVSFLIDLNDEKAKNNAKKPTEAAKYAAASKKWTDVYDKIK
jgi:hypothetical protein